MVDNGLSHFPKKCPECVCVRVCVSENVLSFLFWSTGALDGGRRRTNRRREGERVGRRIFHLNLLVFHCPLWSFFSRFFLSFVWPLSVRAECSTRPHALCMCGYVSIEQCPGQASRDPNSLLSAACVPLRAQVRLPANLKQSFLSNHPTLHACIHTSIHPP